MALSDVPPRAELQRRLFAGKLLRMHFPRNDGPQPALVVNTLAAEEGLSRSFRYEAELLSDDASIPLKDVIGKMITISLLRDNGTERHFNGYATEFRYLRTDGGFVFYHVTLEPWLAFARLRKDCRSFLNRGVLEITEKVLAEYPQHDWKIRMCRDDPNISYANQYNETDYNHLHRRWEAAGLYYWYEHRIDGHTLWLSDDSAVADTIDACAPYDVERGTIPYRDHGGAFERDGIRQWQAVRCVGSASLTLATFDYKKPSPRLETAYSRNRQGMVPQHDLYENLGEYGFCTSREGEELAQRRMEDIDRMTQFFEASGNDRCVLPGRSFMLAGHFSSTMKWPAPDYMRCQPIRTRQYLIVAVSHAASNSLHSTQREPSYYRNEFTCQRKTIRWRPGRHFHSEPPPAPGVQTALVTGIAGQEIHTDGHGRIKVQFHWDRKGKYDENSSTWIRVAMPVAGGAMGQIGLPRVGQEVVVQFLAENPDRPIVTGIVYNGSRPPPWQLPHQHALTGLRSRELKGSGRGNQLVLDDTPNQIQAQLRSDHQHSQLTLGHIHRLETNAGHQEARGEGWELRTDGHGVARAGQGMVITTDARSAASGHAKDIGETVQRLAAAAEIQSQLADIAQHHGAQEAGQGAVQQADAAADLAAQNDAIRGGGKGQFAELTEPHLVMASPAGIELASAQSTHIASARHTAISSGKSLAIASVDGLFASIGKTFRLFVHKAGMKLIAAGGKVTVQAQSDDVEVIANKVLSLLSETDWVEIRGKKGVRLHGANHMLEIGDKVQFFTSSPVLFNGNLETLAPKSISQSFNERPADCKFDQEVSLLLVDDKPAADVSYEILREDGAAMPGKSPVSGSTGVQNSTGMDSYTIRWKGELP